MVALCHFVIWGLTSPCNMNRGQILALQLHRRRMMMVYFQAGFLHNVFQT